MVRVDRQSQGQTNISRIPIVLGVTGHRDLRGEDVPPLEKVVREFFHKLQSAHSHTPLVLLSPLAEGADRLVAKVALELGMRLVCPLPMPRTVYEEDFRTVESKAEFRQLLDRAESWFEVELCEGTSLTEIQLPGPSRDRQYARVGALIAAHSQVLIALWDGVESGLVGGTSQVVKFQIEGIPQPYGPARNPLDAVETGPAIHIRTPRQKNPAVARALEVQTLFPKGWISKDQAEHFFRSVRIRVDRFNEDVARLTSRPVQAEQSAEWLLPSTEAAKLPEELRKLRNAFAVADALALNFQRVCGRTLLGLFALAASAAVFVNAYSDLAERGVLLWLYLGSLLAGFAWYALAHRANWQNRHQDYRALAEGLRVAFFWRLAGLRESVADHYLRKQRGELEWIREALRAGSAAVSLKKGGGDEGSSLPMVLQRWIQDQGAYYMRAARRDRKLLWRMELSAALFFAASIILAVVQALLPAGISLLVFAVDASPLACGLLAAYAQKRGLQEHAAQYARMQTTFARAESAMKESLDRGSIEDARTLVFELGKEALLEHGDWLHLHRSQKIELPR